MMDKLCDVILLWHDTATMINIDGRGAKQFLHAAIILYTSEYIIYQWVSARKMLLMHSSYVFFALTHRYVDVVRNMYQVHMD